MPELIQRAGRAVRDPAMHDGLFLLMFEPWALQVQLPAADDIGSDPDRPIAGMVKKTSSKQDRTSCACIQFVQSSTCLRGFLASYLKDDGPSGLTVQSLCCCANGITSLTVHHPLVL